MLVIYLITRLRSKFTNCLANVATLNELLWGWINFVKRLVGSVLLSKFKYVRYRLSIKSLPIRYHNRLDARHAMRYVNGTRLDDRIIRTDWDTGFIEGRQFGRGKSGVQVRDEYREDYDEGRGGYGKQMMNNMKNQGFPSMDTE